MPSSSKTASPCRSSSEPNGCRAFTRFAVQCRCDDEPEDLSLDRTVCCNRAEALIERVQPLIG